MEFGKTFDSINHSHLNHRQKPPGKTRRAFSGDGTLAYELEVAIQLAGMICSVADITVVTQLSLVFISGLANNPCCLSAGDVNVPGPDMVGET